MVARLVHEDLPAGSPWREEIESYLNSAGVDWKRMPGLRLATIDKRMSLNNQARLEESLNDDQVVIYAQAMEQGAIFPAVVVWRMEDAVMCVVSDGNHRVAAAELAGIDTMPAYMVDDPSEAQVVRITYAGNRTGGRGSTMMERIHHAASLVDRFGMTIVAAAKETGAPESRVAKHMRRRDAERRIRRVSPYVAIAALSNLDRLSAIRSDDVLRAFAPVAALLGAEAVNKAVTEINRARSEADQLVIVDEWRKRAQDLQRATASFPRGGARSSHVRLVSVLNRMSGLPTPEQVKTIAVSLQPGLRRRIQETIDKLDAIANELHP